MKISLDEKSLAAIETLNRNLVGVTEAVTEANRINTEILDFYQLMVEKNKNDSG